MSPPLVTSVVNSKVGSWILLVVNAPLCSYLPTCEVGNAIAELQLWREPKRVIGQDSY